jgi:cytochrome c oxidase assembly protein subunit 11
MRSNVDPQHRSVWLWVAGLLVVATLAVGAWLFWRFTAPVRVTLAGTAPSLPFEIEITPADVLVRPGEVVSVTYRIHNNNLTPIAAFGRLEFDPPQAEDQVQVFLTQCGGLNTYQNGQSVDLAVVFRVEPAGLFGSSTVTLRHAFDPAAPG